MSSMDSGMFLVITKDSGVLKGVAHEGQLLSVCVPGVDIDRTLSAEKFQQKPIIASVVIHEPQLDIHVGQMFLCIKAFFAVGKIHNPFPVGDTWGNQLLRFEKVIWV